jgi:TP901 family phage tail tape measure protein
MANNIAYILSLNDQISSKLGKISGMGDTAVKKFKALSEMTKKVETTMHDMGNSVGSLRQKLELLKAEKEWIPQSNLNSIRAYNTEIKKLEKEIQHLDTINGSVFKRNMKDAISNLPFSNLITNPVALAGAGLFSAGKSAFDFEEGMAKINTTAQLSQPNLEKLGKNLRSIGVEYGADLNTVPDAFEKILSQTGDVKVSTDILKQALKGSKAGFTDQIVVADALAQTLSVVGKENTNAKEVLDTFFQAKNVGAGEFKDFAQYMPGLIASGKALGINFKETAGVFSYMTGKGQSAERSAVLMENAFSALGKTDIRENLKAEGINVFDEKGTIRSMTAIFKDLEKRMKGMSNEDKSSFLAKMGLVDKEARSAFIIMTDETKKLSNVMNEVKNSTGAADEALKNSMNNKQKLQQLWSRIQDLSITLGGAIAGVLVPAFDILASVLSPVLSATSWLIEMFDQNKTVIVTLAAVYGALWVASNADLVMKKLLAVWEGRSIIQKKLKVAWIWLENIAVTAVTGAIKLLIGAEKVLNAVMAMNPFGAVIVLLAGLAAGAYALTKMLKGASLHTKIMGEVTKEANMRMIDEKVALDQLFGQLKKTNPGTEERKKLVEELNQKYPDLLDKYDLETAKLKDLDKIQKEVSKNMYKKITQEIKVEKAKELMKSAEDMKDNWAGFGSTSRANEIKWKKIKALQKEAQLLLEEANKPEEEKKSKLQKQVDAHQKIVELLDTEEKINAKIQELQGLKGSEKIGSKKYKQYIAEISRLQKLLNGGSSSGGGGKTGVGASTNEAIATGGVKQTTINLNFKNVVESLVVRATDLQNSADQIEQQVGDALLRTLGMAVTTAG